MGLLETRSGSILNVLLTKGAYKARGITVRQAPKHLSGYLFD